MWNHSHLKLKFWQWLYQNVHLLPARDCLLQCGLCSFPPANLSKETHSKTRWRSCLGNTCWCTWQPMKCSGQLTITCCMWTTVQRSVTVLPPWRYLSREQLKRLVMQTKRSHQASECRDSFGNGCTFSFTLCWALETHYASDLLQSVPMAEPPLVSTTRTTLFQLTCVNSILRDAKYLRVKCMRYLLMY